MLIWDPNWVEGPTDHCTIMGRVRANNCPMADTFVETLLLLQTDLKAELFKSPAILSFMRRLHIFRLKAVPLLQFSFRIISSTV